MTKNLLIVLLVGVFALGGLVGYLIHSPSVGISLGGANPSSTVISYYAALNKQVLWDVLNSMWIDVTAVRAPLGGLATGSASVSWGTLNTTDSASSTVINIPLGGTIGDAVIVSPAASGTAVFSGAITTTGSTNASATIYATVASSTGISEALGTPTMRVWVLPTGSFTAPAALRTTTSTSY